VKGAEYEAVIAYALLEDMVPHFTDPQGDVAANRMLYVIYSRAKKNLHLISERGRVNRRGEEYQVTTVLADCGFAYDEIP
jgi:superfamily I DNA/RNA helicase